MIVDCHHHIFENWATPCGHPSDAVHKKYLQRMLAPIAATTLRARDGAPADTAPLSRNGDLSWGGLEDVNLRAGRFGRVEFTAGGEDFFIQFMPVGMQKMEAPPELAMAQMVYAGVDHAILQSGGGYGVVNDLNGLARRRWPERFTGLVNVDEALAAEPENLAGIERAYRDLGLAGIHYDVEGFARHGYAWEMDDGRMDPLWETLDSLGMVVCLELGCGASNDAAGHVDLVGRLAGLMDRFPALRWHLVMGPPVKLFGRGGCWDLPDELAGVYRRENLVVEVMFPISMGAVWDYPYVEAQALIRDFRDRFGAEKMVWGSDMPNVERYCTYRQCLDYVRRYCDFLTGREMDLVLGGNAARFYGITASAAS